MEDASPRPEIKVAGPPLTADIVKRWRTRARNDMDRAVLDVVERNLEDVIGAVDYGDSIDVEFRSGERVAMQVDQCP